MRKKIFVDTVDSNMTGNASYNPTNDQLKIKDPNNLTVEALKKEFFHAFQNKVAYPGGTSQYAGSGTTGSANIELEAKVLRDLDGIVNGSGSMKAVAGSGYQDYLDDLSNGYTKFPSSLSSGQVSSFKSFLPDFIGQNPGYSNTELLGAK